MRVYHITEKINELAGGTSTHIARLAAATVEAGQCPVEIVTFDLRRLGKMIKTPDNVKMTIFEPSRPYMYGWSRKFSSYIRETAADRESVFHVHNMWRLPMVEACKQAARNKRPSFVSPHGALNPVALSAKPLRKRFFWWLIERKRLKNSTVLRATSIQEAQYLRELIPGAPIAIVPPGTDLPELPESKPENNQKTALFLSRIIPNKGPLLLLKAWSIIRPENWRLVIAGSDEVGHLADLRRAVRQYGLEDSVSFIGPTFQDKKWRPYLEADLFILPTLSENFGIAIAEALASGLPVITTHGAPWEKLISHDCGWWVEIGAEPLIKAMREAFEADGEELRQMGRRGRELVEKNYTWPSVARQMIEAYKWAEGGGDPPECIILKDKKVSYPIMDKRPDIEDRPAEEPAAIRVLAKHWEDGYPGYHLLEGQVRIKVSAWRRLHQITDAYILPPKSVNKVLTYSLDIGLIQTLRKIQSRRGERIRNLKYVSFGFGRVTSDNTGGEYQTGDAVSFIAPFHPPCVDNICLHTSLVRRLENIPDALDDQDALFEGEQLIQDWPWSRIAGWCEFSGREPDHEILDKTFNRITPVLFSETVMKKLRRLPAPARQGRRLEKAQAPVPGKKSAALFGFGHYAKNVILPRIGKYLDVVAIHEIDPTQVGRKKYKAQIRTSPWPKDDESYDVYLIAGFNHTHGKLAIEALSRGAVAMVEKPLTTSFEDLDQVVELAGANSGRIFTAFQRRYTPLNQFIKQDLKINESTPVSCRCIAYEIPMPKNHWYQWPNSKGRVLSNGCHWIDHFLFLNSFAKPENIEGRKLKNGDCVVLIDLENGASFSMTITDHGTSRLGVRDHVQFTVGERTAFMTDSHRYQSENHERIIRKTSINKMEPYNVMYNEIGRRIMEELPGDSVRSMEVSTRTALIADQQVE
jgi:glycosyltransferase involved in cell wall biosynthesis/predicted dehydrogenase